MIEQRFTDKALKEAASKVRTSMLASLSTDTDYALPTEVPHEFQLYHTQQLKKKTAKKRIIAAAIAFFVSTALFFSIHTEAKAIVQKWIKELFSDKIVYWVTESPSTVLPTYEPSWMPDGYERIYDESMDTGRVMLYQKGTDPMDGISLNYEFSSAESPLHIFLQNSDYTIKEVKIGNNSGDLCISSRKDETHALIWVDENTNIVFCITAYLDPDIILHIAESIYLVD